MILESSLSFSETYDDNVFFGDNDAERQTAEFISTISPRLHVTFTSKNINLALGYGGSLELHSTNSGEDGFFQSLTANLGFPALGRRVKGLGVKIREKILYVPQLQAFSFKNEEVKENERFDRTLQGSEGVQSERIDTLQNRAEILMDYRWSHLFSIEASYVNVITRYSGGDREDREVHNGDIVGTYHYFSSPKTEWRSSYGAFWGASEGDVELFQQINFGVSHKIRRLVSVWGNAGISFVESISPQLVFDARFSKRFKKGRLDLRYKNRVVRGEGVIEELARRESILIETNWRFEQEKSLFLRSGYVSTDSVKGNDTNVTAYYVEGGVSIFLLSWLNGNISYSHLTQKSKGNLGKDGEKNVIKFTLTAVGPSWRILK
ncbi:MAG: hypothetical protein ACE5FU_10035 [Nitrospinota bacterium]